MRPGLGIKKLNASLYQEFDESFATRHHFISVVIIIQYMNHFFINDSIWYPVMVIQFRGDTVSEVFFLKFKVMCMYFKALSR